MNKDTLSSNNTIAKNTVFLYLRLAVTMLISLYTSRVLLQVLGVDDYGLYGLVVGIVTMFASLKTMFTVATQRYLNIEIGSGNDYELNKVFNVSLLFNFLIAILFVIVVEVVGLWLLESKLRLSLEQFDSAKCVFHITIFASVFQIFNVPYESDIIAHEKMDFFAIVTIIDAITKLGIVLILPFFRGDKLIIYALLLCICVGINLTINVFYCHVKFSETRLRFFSSNELKSKFREMFTFSSWSFLGNLIFVLVHEGINILLNVFGSLVANAARTITYQVGSALTNVVSNVYVAIKPQTIQSYARHDTNRFYSLMFTGGKIVGYMYILMAIPLYFSLSEILTWWLGNVPNYAESFIKATLLYHTIRVLHQSIDSFFVSIGRLREYQIIEFILLGSCLPLSYFALKIFDMPLYGVFFIMSFSELINFVAILLLARRIGNFPVGHYLKTVLSPYCLIIVVSFCVIFVFQMVMSTIVPNIVVRTIVFIILAVIILILIMYGIGFSKEERLIIVNIFKRFRKD